MNEEDYFNLLAQRESKKWLISALLLGGVQILCTAFSSQLELISFFEF
jgi:hypothetical protein